jgi:CRISPR-associated protein (TIGR03986 family)
MIKPETYTLGILGEPKPSAYEFYLERPNGANYWNYDFRGTGAERKGEDCKYEYYTPTIRGRKMYWHSENIKTTRKTGKLNATMEGVKAGSEFSFKVYFDEITQKQLDDLIWVISLGENKQDSKIQYKMGHGKPLGFGSVKLVVNSQTIRKIGDDLRVNTTVIDIKNSTTSRSVDDSDISFDSETVKALLKMANAETTQELIVSYPISLDKYGKEDTRVFSWFSENHKNSRNLVSLPYPTEQKITLPAGHQKSGGNNKYKGSKFKGRF